MFEKLDSIEWGKLHHCYGTAGDIPQLLRDLLSPDGDVAGLAQRQLHESLWHQGSVFEASAYIIPFLVEVLRSSAAPYPVEFAYLLAMLTQGTDDLRVELASTDQWFLATREALRPDVDVLFPYLSYRVPEVRQYVARALAFYPERAEETLPLLKQALKVEEDAFTRADMEKAIQILTEVSQSRGRL